MRILAVLMAGVLVLGLCVSTGRAQSGMTWKVAIGGDTPDHGVQYQGYAPGTITINAGDTVTWTMAPLFEHTVTFLSGTKPPDLGVPQNDRRLLFHPAVAFPQGLSTYAGKGVASSGVLETKKSWSLTFTKPGSYAYVCLLHPGMAGTVIVKPAGASLPYTQVDYDRRGAKQVGAALEKGKAALASAKVTMSKGPKGTVYTSPMVATLGGRASVIRFNSETITIKAGDTVRWVMKDPYELHTVTFSGSEQPPEFLIPEPQPKGPPKIYFNSKVVPSAGGQVHAGQGYYNSGFMFLGPHGATNYSLRFTKPGTFTYWCVVHVPEGMKGTIVVQ